MTFSRELNDLPALLCWALIVGLFAAYSAGALLALRPFVRRAAVPRDAAIAGSVFGSLGAFNSLLLALIVVTLWNNFFTVQQSVNSEAAELAHLGRGIAAFPPRLAAASRAALAKYAGTLVHEELPQMCAGGISPEGDNALDALQTKVLAMRLPPGDSALRTNVLDRLTRIDDLRRVRISAAKPFILWEVWLAVLFLSALTLASPAFFNTENMTLQLSMTLMFATGLATLFFIAVRLDYVFCGSTAVSYDALADVARSLAR